VLLFVEHVHIIRNLDSLEHGYFLNSARRVTRGENSMPKRTPALRHLATLCTLFICMSTLSGCATRRGQDIPSPEELFTAVNHTYAGRPFNDVLLRYGQPVGQVPRGQLIVYQFQASNTVRLQEPVTTTTVGRVGAYDANVPYAERTTGWQGYNQDMRCMRRVGVRADGTVDGADFVGQMGACQVFMP
jgi:hypothetical protein